MESSCNSTASGVPPEASKLRRIVSQFCAVAPCPGGIMPIPGMQALAESTTSNKVILEIMANST
jgi:hypothetical protein